MVQNIGNAGNLQADRQATGGQTAPVSRSSTFLHALAFVLGFGAIFTLLGSAAGLLGQSLNSYLPLIQRFGAILLLLFGLTTIGIVGWIVNRVQANEKLVANPAVAALLDILRFLNALMYTERRVADLHKVKRGVGLSQQRADGCQFQRRLGPLRRPDPGEHSNSWPATAPPPPREPCCWRSTVWGWGCLF